MQSKCMVRGGRWDRIDYPQSLCLTVEVDSTNMNNSLHFTYLRVAPSSVGHNLSSLPAYRSRQARFAPSFLPYNAATSTRHPHLPSSNHDPCRGSSIGRACGSYDSKEMNLKVVGSSPTFGYSYIKAHQSSCSFSFLSVRWRWVNFWLGQCMVDYQLGLVNASRIRVVDGKL